MSINTFIIRVICPFLVSFAAFAQQEVKLTGQVKDSETKDNIPFAKVVALSGEEIIQGGITDDKGFFRLPLKPGVYQVVISSYGFISDTIQTEYIQADHFLGVFKLDKDVQILDEMNAEASSRIDYLDRDVQIITDQHKEGTMATKDVLDRLPGISYDEYTGQLSVDNDANIMILVNGVEKSAEYVQNLDPERLLRVETIRDPGGRYGLEGYAAIINVILRDDYKGTEVYVEEMQLVDIVPERSTLDLLIGSLGLTYNYTKNKLNLYVGARAERKNFKLFTDGITNYDDGYHVLESPISEDPNTNILEYGANYIVGFDYRLNPKHSISFEGNVSALPFRTSNNRFENWTEIYSGDSLVSDFAFTTKTNSQTLDTYGSVFYIGEFNERNRLNANFTYSYYQDEYFMLTSQVGDYDRDESGTNNRQYTRLYVEYDHDFSAKVSGQLGYGNTWRELNNDFSVTQTDVASGVEQQFSSDFFQGDVRHKLYTNVSWNMSKRWGLRIGAAAENSSPRTQGQQLNYLIYQPMFDLRFVANGKLNMILKYRTSNDYPSLSQINPFTSLMNPRMTSTGNPFLRPYTVHRFSLRVNAWQGLLSLEPYAHYSNNTIVNIGELGVDNIFNFRYENAALYQRNGVKLNFSKYFKFSLLVQGNLDVYQSKIVSTSRTNELMDWSADVDVIYIFKKTQSLLGLKYQRQLSKAITGLGYERGDVDFWLLFYKQPLFKQQASVMFGYFLPLNFAVGYNQGSYVEADGFELENNNDVSLIKNMFILEFNVRINKGKAVRKKEKELELEQEDGGNGLF